MKQKSRTLRGCLRYVDSFGKCLMFFDLNGEMVKKKKKSHHHREKLHHFGG